MIKIGNIELTGKAILAPMAGATDFAYRTVCMQMGAALTVTEMVSAKALEFNDEKSFRIAELDENARPVSIQVFGNDPLVMAQSAEKLMCFSPDIIDINMGCPVPKIAGNNSGSALMKTPKLCGEIVEAVKKAVNLPVTVKIRKGWDDSMINAVEVAKICEDAGAAAIAVHGRTRTQMYSGKADRNIIKEVKNAVKVPVIGNGDIISGKDAVDMMNETGCDLVMVGRGALGNPWIFAEINRFVNGDLNPIVPSLEERMKVITNHITKLCERNGEGQGMREARKHVAWYFHGLKGAAECRRRAGGLCTLDDLKRLLDDVYMKNQQG